MNSDKEKLFYKCKSEKINMENNKYYVHENELFVNSFVSQVVSRENKIFILNRIHDHFLNLDINISYSEYMEKLIPLDEKLKKSHEVVARAIYKKFFNYNELREHYSKHIKKEFKNYYVDIFSDDDVDKFVVRKLKKLQKFLSIDHYDSFKQTCYLMIVSFLKNIVCTDAYLLITDIKSVEILEMLNGIDKSTFRFVEAHIVASNIIKKLSTKNIFIVDFSFDKLIHHVIPYNMRLYDLTIDADRNEYYNIELNDRSYCQLFYYLVSQLYFPRNHMRNSLKHYSNILYPSDDTEKSLSSKFIIDAIEEIHFYETQTNFYEYVNALFYYDNINCEYAYGYDEGLPNYGKLGKLKYVNCDSIILAKKSSIWNLDFSKFQYVPENVLHLKESISNETFHSLSYYINKEAKLEAELNDEPSDDRDKLDIELNNEPSDDNDENLCMEDIFG